MKDDRLNRAIVYLRGGTADDLTAALALVRDLEREARETPEEQHRRKLREVAARTEKALAPAAAACAKAVRAGRVV